MQRTLIWILASSLFAFSAHAEENCKYSEARNLKLELGGIKTVVFDVGQHDLRVDAAANGNGMLSGHACASNAEDLPRLSLTQEKQGDKLIVRLQRVRQPYILSFGDHYAYLKISGTISDTLPVQVKVGSGDAVVSGAQSLSADVGSGDVQANRIRNGFFAALGSGDIEATDVGTLHVLEIGSGDVSVQGIRGTSQIGKIGSGDLEVSNAKGDLSIKTIGSGDVELKTIGGKVNIGAIGSGNLTIQDAGGNVHVESIESGDLQVRNIRGNFVVDSVGSASVQHDGVTGRVTLPSKH